MAAARARLAQAPAAPAAAASADADEAIETSDPADTWDEFQALPREPVTADIHCVTKWSKFATVWEGVSVDTLLAEAAARGIERAPYVLAVCDGPEAYHVELRRARLPGTAPRCQSKPDAPARPRRSVQAGSPYGLKSAFRPYRFFANCSLTGYKSGERVSKTSHRR